MDSLTINAIYTMCKKIVEQYLPAELIYFDDLWAYWQPYFLNIDVGGEKTKYLTEKIVFPAPEKPSSNLPSWSIMKCVNSVVINYLMHTEMPEQTEFIELVVSKLHEHRNLSNEEIPVIAGGAWTILLADIRSLDNKSTVRRDVITDDLVMISMSICERQLQVFIKGVKDETFCGSERMFCMLLRLAAARAVGDGWVHREEGLHELNPGAQALYDLRKHLVVVMGLKGILGINKLSKGNVRLDLPSNVIKIRESICDFESCHINTVKDRIDWVPRTDESKKRFFKDRKDSKILTQEVVALTRNTLLVAESARMLGWKLRSIECLSVLRTFVSLVPCSQHDWYMDELNLIEQLRLILIPRLEREI